MRQLRQRTVGDLTLTLHRRPNPIPEVQDTPYLYEIKVNGSTDDECFTRGAADVAFRRAIKDTKRSLALRDGPRPRDFDLGLDGGW